MYDTRDLKYTYSFIMAIFSESHSVLLDTDALHFSNSRPILYEYIYSFKVFTGNCGKVTYYISGSITHKFLIFLYLDSIVGHNYITTNFQYHSRSFDNLNAS